MKAKCAPFAAAPTPAAAAPTPAAAGAALRSSSTFTRSLQGGSHLQLAGNHPGTLTPTSTHTRLLLLHLLLRPLLQQHFRLISISAAAPLVIAVARGAGC